MKEVYLLIDEFIDYTTSYVDTQYNVYETYEKAKEVLDKYWNNFISERDEDSITSNIDDYKEYVTDDCRETMYILKKEIL